MPLVAQLSARYEGLELAPQLLLRLRTLAAAKAIRRDDDLGSLRNVGVSLFTDYLYAVELAGTALLIATIGAIAIARRRTQGTL